MTLTQYYVASSIDGYIADPDGRLDWLMQFNDVEGVGQHYERFIADVGAIAMGSRTYEFVLGEGIPWPYTDRPAWVFTSRELPPIPGADLRFTYDDVADVHAEMLEAAGHRNIWLIGGGALVAAFAARGLLDEIWLGVAPVTLGAGAPLLPLRIDTPMQLTEVTRFGDTFVELRYRLSRAAEGFPAALTALTDR
jgi:dihydrofolate reductase